MVHKSVEEDPVLREMVRRLVDAYHPLCIYLFGSRATDCENADSDYDLLVVISHSPLPVYQRAKQAFRLLCGVGAAKDVLVLTADEFERKTRVPTSLPATVKREGRVLYAA
jgi:predicted nucleotidyltransferase